MTISSNSPISGGLLTSSVNLEKKGQAGEKICRSMKNLYRAGKALQFAAQHGGNVCCQTTTIATGIYLLCATNPVTATIGGSLALVGAKKLYDECTSSESEVTDLLQDARASLAMIETLEAANDQSFSIVTQNLDTAKQYIKKLSAEVEEIEQIADHGLEEVSAKKAEAKKLYEEAHHLFSKAQQEFASSESKLRSADSIFKQISKGFKELFELATSDKGSLEEKLAQFVKIAKKMHKQCGAANFLMKSSGTHLSEGQAILAQAIDKQKEAFGATQSAISISETALKMQKELSSSMRQHQQRLDDAVSEAQEQIADIEERRKDIKALNHNVADMLVQAEELDAEKFGNVSLIMGVCLGGAAGAAAGGGVGGAVGAVAGVKVVHELRHRQHANFQKVCDALFGIKVTESNERLIKNDKVLVAYKFDEHSSGFWNRYVQKKQSYTTGEIRINLGSEELSLRFNLGKKNKIAMKELVDLRKYLSAKVEDKSLSPARCLQIISQLEKIEIDRSRGGHSTARDVISQTGALIFSDLKRDCLKLTEQK